MKPELLHKLDAMTFNRSLLPDPATYFENQGLTLKGPGSAKWKTTTCNFHGGSDSLRVNVATGAWVCMSCGEKGGDVLAHHIAAHGLTFVDAAKALGCWHDDGKPQTAQRPKPLSPREALSVLAVECTLIAVAAANIGHGVPLTPTDLIRVLLAAGRVNSISEAFR